LFFAALVLCCACSLLRLGCHACGARCSIMAGSGPARCDARPVANAGARRRRWHVERSRYVARAEPDAMVRGLPRVSARSEKALRADQAQPRRYRVIVDISQRPRTFGASRGRTARALHLGGLSSPPTPAEATHLVPELRGLFDRQGWGGAVFARRCRQSASLRHGGDVGCSRTAGVTPRQTRGAFKVGGRHPQGLRRRSGGRSGCSG